MTATGFVLLALGIILLRGFGSAWYEQDNKADHIGTACLSIGLIMSVVGVAVFLWRAMP